MKKKSYEELETEVFKLKETLGNLLEWLENDTLEIMKDTRTMGITFDSTDCSRLRQQIELAAAALDEPEGETK
jgi:hypothetical protein